MLAYRELSDADLFATEWVRIMLHPREMPGYKSPRIACASCGEGISYDREIVRDGATLCLACAFPETRYYQALDESEDETEPTAAAPIAPPQSLCDH